MKRLAAILMTTFVAVTLASQQPAYAAPADVQMPFPCGETWYASTYAGHDPSEKSIDWNLPGDDSGRSVRAGVAGIATIKPFDPDGYGNWVEVNAGNGWTYRYAHLSAITVSNGAVTAQTEIGKVGSTGQATGSHLHYEQRLNGSVQTATFNGAAVSYAYSLPGNPYTSANCQAINARLMGDVNADGKTDAVVMYGASGTAKVALSNGSAFGYPGDWSAMQSAGAGAYYLSDVNGDQRADLIAYFTTTRTWKVSLSSGSGFWAPTEWGYDDSLVPDRTYFADANGDARADKIMFIAGTWYVGLSSGSGFWAPQAWISGHGIGSSDQAVGDFNHDGLADTAVYFGSSGNWYVSSSTGTSFGYPGQWSAGHGLGTTFRLPGDVTGDGKADIVYFSAPNSKWYTGASSGSGFWSPAEWSYDGSGFNGMDNAFVTDVNGDSRADKVLFYRSTGNWYAALSSGGGFWPLTLWISGHGAGS